MIPELTERLIDVGDLLAECFGHAVARLERGERLEGDELATVRRAVLSWHNAKALVIE